MPSNLRPPPPRNLDIYRLVVARGLKQTAVAENFGVTPVRICQIIRRVRRWVDSTVGDWLFPRQDNFRFYAALAVAQIRIHQLADDPLPVVITGPGWNYQRAATKANPPASASATHAPNKPQISAANLSSDPLNPFTGPPNDAIAATPCPQAESPPQYIADLGRQLAELLMLWQKSRRITGAFKSWH